jgi:hypothetical protein
MEVGSGAEDLEAEGEAVDDNKRRMKVNGKLMPTMTTTRQEAVKVRLRRLAWA